MYRRNALRLGNSNLRYLIAGRDARHCVCTMAREYYSFTRSHVPTWERINLCLEKATSIKRTSSVDQTKVGIAVWGDSPKTTEIDGAIEGERFNVFYADKNGRRYDIDYEIIEGTDIYKPDELLVIQWRDSKFADPKYGIMPNVGSTPGVTINLKEAAQINLVLCDLKGKKIADVTSGQQTAGAHTFKLDASAAPKGDHLQILRTGNKISIRKMTFAK